MTIAPFANAGKMSVAEYRLKRAELRATYGDTKQEAGGQADQALAHLLYVSGWTQADLAREEGKSQKWIDFHVRFGRFLGLSTTVLIPKSLTERRFRG